MALTQARRGPTLTPNQNLTKIINTPGDQTRGFLYGELGEALLRLLHEVRDSDRTLRPSHARIPTRTGLSRVSPARLTRERWTTSSASAAVQPSRRANPAAKPR